MQQVKEFLSRIYCVLWYGAIFSLFKLWPVHPKKLVFVSYTGRTFSCNPRAIYRYIRNNYHDVKCVVVLNHPAHHLGLNANRDVFVKYHSLSFLFHMATARYWIVNTNIHHYLKPRKKTIYVQTWHAGGAFKKFGKDIIVGSEKDKKNWVRDAVHWTYLLCSSSNVIEIYSRAFDVDKSKIIALGLPRNDLLIDRLRWSEAKERIYRKLNISGTKKVILYAPTFRDHEIPFVLKLDLGRLCRMLSSDYVMLLRLHPNVSNEIAIEQEYSHFLINASFYDDVQELLLAADVLVTDYSSIIFDFCITGRPIVFYPYDLEFYENQLRGFYFDYESFVPGPIVYNDSDLITVLSDHPRLADEWSEAVAEFSRTFNEYGDGRATERVVNLLFSGRHKCPTTCAFDTPIV